MKREPVAGHRGDSKLGEKDPVSMHNARSQGKVRNQYQGRNASRWRSTRSSRRAPWVWAGTVRLKYRTGGATDGLDLAEGVTYRRNPQREQGRRVSGEGDRGRRLFRWIGRATVVVLVVLGVLVGGSGLSNVGLEMRSDAERLSEAQRALMEEALHLRRTLGDRVWPGWGAMEIPQIVYNERFAFLGAYPGAPPAGWYREPAHEHLGGPWSPVPGDAMAGQPIYRQQLPAGVSPQAFTVRVGDRWVGSIPTLEWSRASLGRQIRDALPAVLEWLPPYRLLGRLFFRGSEHQVALTLHETFHAFQGATAPDHFAAAEAGMAGVSYPLDEPELVAAWQAELELLAEALGAIGVEEKERLAAAFLEARSRRRDRLAPELHEYERRREWLEGLAKYVELEAWWAADTTASYQPQPAAREAGLDAYSGASSAQARELGQLRRSAGQGETLFYYSGMAQAELLDQLGQDWKAAAVPGGRPPELLLAEAIE